MFKSKFFNKAFTCFLFTTLISQSFILVPAYSKAPPEAYSKVDATYQQWLEEQNKNGGNSTNNVTDDNARTKSDAAENDWKLTKTQDNSTNNVTDDNTRTKSDAAENDWKLTGTEVKDGHFEIDAQGNEIANTRVEQYCVDGGKCYDKLKETPEQIAERTGNSENQCAKGYGGMSGFCGKAENSGSNTGETGSIFDGVTVTEALGVVNTIIAATALAFTIYQAVEHDDDTHSYAPPYSSTSTYRVINGKLYNESSAYNQNGAISGMTPVDTKNLFSKDGKLYESSYSGSGATAKRLLGEMPKGYEIVNGKLYIKQGLVNNGQITYKLKPV